MHCFQDQNAVLFRSFPDFFKSRISFITLQALTFGVVVGLHSLIYLEGKFPRSSDSSAVDVLHLFFSCTISFMLISGNRFSVRLTLH